jgi:hypothetical protein
MRRLNRDDEGITIVVVTIGMACLLLMAALGLDIGSAFFNKARAQNSADARALAAAINCANGQTISTALPALQSGQTVVAPDGLDISSCAGNNQVTATVTKEQDFQFLPQHLTIDRRATAKWGTVAGANVLPITIASCEWSLARLDGNTDITLYLDDPKVDSGCNSLPGGFSQLDRGSDGQCSIGLDGNNDAGGDPGGDLKKQIPCVTNTTGSPLPHDVLVPIYDVSILTKANHDNGQGPYHILGFAEFHVTGYSFNGAGSSAGSLSGGCPPRPPDPLNPGAKDPKYCIRGDFIRMLAPGDTVPGPGQDFGVTKVYLIS